MAKRFAEKFYKTKLWGIVRGQVLRRDLFTCQLCGERATEVHHIIELTPENINDPNITLNMNNLESRCHDCHSKETKNAFDVGEGYYFDENGQVVQQKNIAE